MIISTIVDPPFLRTLPKPRNRKMNVLVRVHDDDLELEIATPAISHSANPSSKT